MTEGGTASKSKLSTLPHIDSNEILTSWMIDNRSSLNLSSGSSGKRVRFPKPLLSFVLCTFQTFLFSYFGNYPAYHFHLSIYLLFLPRLPFLVLVLILQSNVNYVELFLNMGVFFT